MNSYKAATNWMVGRVRPLGAIYIVVVVAAGFYFSFKTREPEIAVISLLLGIGSSALVLSELLHPRKNKNLKHRD